jgi:hypothetical protein
VSERNLRRRIDDSNCIVLLVQYEVEEYIA